MDTGYRGVRAGEVRMKKWILTLLLVSTMLASYGCAGTPSPSPGPTPAPAPVSSVLPAEHPRDFPENLRWLTDEEKEQAVTIALGTPEAQEWLKKESRYKTSIDWIALNPNPEGEGYSGYRRFEYGIVAEGIPRGEVDITPPGSPERVVSLGVPDDAEIYPNVTIWFGESARWVVSVAVDLKTGKAVYAEGYPNYECPNDSCHWWEIDVLPIGKAVLVVEGGAPLPYW